jgi:hypothetical protein
MIQGLNVDIDSETDKLQISGEWSGAVPQAESPSLEHYLNPTVKPSEKS